MFTLEEIEKKYEEMNQAIKGVTGGNSVEDADAVFNAVDEQILFVAENVQNDKHGTVTIEFLVGRASSEREDGLFDFETTLIISTLDKTGGIVDSDDYSAYGLSEDEARSECFLPFLTILNQYA